MRLSTDGMEGQQYTPRPRTKLFEEGRARRSQKPEVSFLFMKFQF